MHTKRRVCSKMFFTTSDTGCRGASFNSATSCPMSRIFVIPMDWRSWKMLDCSGSASASPTKPMMESFGGSWQANGGRRPCPLSRGEGTARRHPLRLLLRNHVAWVTLCKTKPSSTSCSVPRAGGDLRCSLQICGVSRTSALQSRPALEGSSACRCFPAVTAADLASAVTVPLFAARGCPAPSASLSARQRMRRRVSHAFFSPYQLEQS